MSLRLERLGGALPTSFTDLRAAAEDEGYRMLSRLEAEWAGGEQRFDRPGEALIGAWLAGGLVGVGGITREPTAPAEPMLRLRRFYVLPRARRRGVARAMAMALIAEAAEPIIILNAAAGSRAFWERLGFSPVAGRGWTHERRRPSDAP